MKVLITGAGGMVGLALTRVLGERYEVIARNHAQLDITSASEVKAAFLDLQPDIVINCAVLNVDQCELDPAEADRINVTGPGLLASTAAWGGAAIVHFSTNYVFDGFEEKLYTQVEPANPVNYYGVSKLKGEVAVLSANEKSLVIRTSWVFGNGKGNFLSTIFKRLSESTRTTVVEDCWASATYVEDLAARTRDLIDRRASGIFQVVNSGVTSYLDFTLEAGKLAGLSEDRTRELIDLVSDADLGRPARRPRYTPMSCLNTEKLGLSELRDWRQALAEFTARPVVN